MCFRMVAPSLVIIVVLSVWIILSMPFGPRLERMASATPTRTKKKLASLHQGFWVRRGVVPFAAVMFERRTSWGFSLSWKRPPLPRDAVAAMVTKMGTRSEEVMWWLFWWAKELRSSLKFSDALKVAHPNEAWTCQYYITCKKNKTLWNPMCKVSSSNIYHQEVLVSL